METIKQVLMRRDGMSSDEADELIADAKADLAAIAADPTASILDAEGVIEEYFGLEPDYLMELLNEVI